MERLAGRLQWEQMDGRIRVMIPGRPGSLDLVALLLEIACGAVGVSVLPVLLKSDSSAVEWVDAAICGVVMILGAGMLLWNFTGRTIMTLDPIELTLERRVAGVQWDIRRFRSDDVRDIRYVAPEYIHPFRTDTDPQSSSMRLTSGGKVHRFARGITEREACALMDQIAESHAIKREVSDTPAGRL